MRKYSETISILGVAFLSISVPISMVFAGLWLANEHDRYLGTVTVVFVCASILSILALWYGYSSDVQRVDEAKLDLLRKAAKSLYVPVRAKLWKGKWPFFWMFRIVERGPAGDEIEGLKYKTIGTRNRAARVAQSVLNEKIAQRNGLPKTRILEQFYYSVEPGPVPNISARREE